MPHGATRRRPGDLSTERWAKQSQKVASKKSGAEHLIQRHSSSPTGLSGGCAKPIFDHAHEKSAKRQGEEPYQAVSGWLKRSTSAPAQRFWRAWGDGTNGSNPLPSSREAT